MNIRFKNMALMGGAMLFAGAFSAPVFSADPMLGTGGYARQFHKMEMMRMIDANSDHMVTNAEYTSFYETTFDELDTDHDGSLDAKEWVGAHGDKIVMVGTGGYSRQLRKMAMMKIMDTDGDHKVTKAEFLKFHQDVFAGMDKNSDQELNPQEWLARQTGNK